MRPSPRGPRKRLAGRLGRRECAQSLPANDELLRALAATPADLVVWYDRRGRVLHLNPAAARLAGTPAPPWSGHPPRVFERLQTVARAAVASGAPGHFDLAMAGPRGHLLLRWHVLPCLAAHGGVSSVLCVGRDASSCQADPPLAHLGQVAGRLAHEFNNLLAVVLGNLSAAEADLPTTSGAAAALQDATTAAGQAAELCRQLLLSAGRDRAVLTVLDPARLLGAVVAHLAAEVAGSTRLRLELVDVLPPIEGDELQLRHAVTELVRNAVTAAGPGGEVTLTASTVDVAPEHLAGALPAGTGLRGPAVRVEVRDDGPGMAAEALARAWVPFYSTEPARRGLGLPTVLSVVRAHGGAVQLEAAAPRGCVATLWWPVAPAVAPAAAAPPPTLPVGLRVLLADDADLVRAMSERMLRLAGCHVRAARHGQEAVDLFQSAPLAFDLVMLDIDMPKLDGTAALAQIRALRPDIPALLVSGFAELDSAQCRCTFLAKPFSRAALTAALAEALAASSA